MKQPGRIVALVSKVLLSIAGVFVAPAQAQLMTFRKVVAVGAQNQNEDVREVDIAVAGNRAMVTFIHDRFQIGYSFFDGQQWTEGHVDGTGFDDPSVVHGTFNVSGVPTDAFLFCYRSAGSVKVRPFDISAGTFDNSVVVATGEPNVQTGYDKAWMVSGRLLGNYHELHAIWYHPFPPAGGVGNIRYANSVDGGLHWTWQPIQDSVTLQYPISKFCTQIAFGDTLSTGPNVSYIAYRVDESGQPKIKFMSGEVGGLGPIFWQFKHLKDGGGADLEVVLQSDPDVDIWGPDVPGKFKIATVPYLVADPTNPDRLYLVFNDHASGTAADFDIFCVTLSRSGTSWTAGDRVRVNDDLVFDQIPGSPPGDDKDQIVPAAKVDDQGRLHIAFYDDRRYRQPDTEEDAAKFDVYYAVSLDGGVTFTNIRLAAIPDEPALQTDLTIPLTGPKHVPGEYLGIACEGDLVWVAFSGTWEGDVDANGNPVADQSVIYVSTILH